MPNTELIPVAKDSDYLEVHPTTLQNHIELGWRVCDRREIAASAVDADAVVPKAKGKKTDPQAPAVDADAVAVSAGDGSVEAPKE
jgi:hypothetical protein